MYSFPNFKPVHCSMSGSNCYFFTCIQISWEAGKVVWYSHLFQNFPQFAMIHPFKGFSSQWSRSRCFSGILLLFQWSNGCWQFDLWFLCLFLIQLEHLEVLSSHTIEAWLGKFWSLLCYHVKWLQLCDSLNILWHCLSLGLETDVFQSCGHVWVFQICWHIECNTLIASPLRFEIAHLEFCQFH